MGTCCGKPAAPLAAPFINGDNGAGSQGSGGDAAAAAVQTDDAWEYEESGAWRPYEASTNRAVNLARAAKRDEVEFRAGSQQYVLRLTEPRPGVQRNKQTHVAREVRVRVGAGLGAWVCACTFRNASARLGGARATACHVCRAARPAVAVTALAIAVAPPPMLAAPPAAAAPLPPPLPPSLLPGAKTFATSHFKRAYEQNPAAPTTQVALRACITAVVRAHPFAVAASDAFVARLCQPWHAGDSVRVVAQKAWTSTEMFAGSSGPEFAFIYSKALRTDEAALAKNLALLARALNINLVQGAGAAMSPGGAGGGNFPRGPAAAGDDKSTTEGACWRGTGFGDDPQLRAFFTPGRKYRCAQFLSTSFKQGVAKTFMRRGGFGQPKCLWKVELDQNLGCDHVNLLKSSAVGSEVEFLFTAFSVFTVAAVQWSQTPTNDATPHTITIRAAYDNKAYDCPTDLPLAPWS